jgi:hypothetical protein
MTDPTEAEVEAQLAETEALAESLEAAVLSGDTKVTHDELVRTKSLVGFLRLQREGARARAAVKAERERVARVKELHDTVAKQVAGSGSELVSLAAAVETAAKAFIAEAAKYDSVLTDLRAELHRLKVKDGDSQQGIGMNGIGQVIIDGTTLDLVDGPRFLGLVFEPSGSGSGVSKLSPGEGWRRDAAFAELEKIAAVK